MDQQLSCQLASNSGAELGSTPIMISYWFTNNLRIRVECVGCPTPSATSTGDDRTDLRGGENAKGTTPPGRAALAANLAPDPDHKHRYFARCPGVPLAPVSSPAVIPQTLILISTPFNNPFPARKA